MSNLFSEYRLGDALLRNRIVMASMTRNRATGHLPNDLMQAYYTQRASAGLILTEGVSPSPNGLGYPRMPGIYTPEQVDAWKPIAKAVHDKGGSIFLQLMHCGRIAHPLNLPEGARVLAPSAVAAQGKIATEQGEQPFPVPEAMTQADIEATVAEFAQAAANAIEAGFDGVELHAGDGYLLEQFLRPTCNRREDAYGGSIENRFRFVAEVIEACIGSVGRHRLGIRLSPYGIYNDMPLYEAMEDDYAYLADAIDAFNIIYVHLAGHVTPEAPAMPDSIKEEFRDVYCGTLILGGGYDAETAEAAIPGQADLISVGRPFIANPDLVERWRTGAALNEADEATFHTAGEAGYTDYPTNQV